jgi:hypothetical protein
LDSADNLDTLFGVLREATLDHRGFRFMNIRYVSDDLQDLRLQHGYNRAIEFKIDPNNLLHALARLPGGIGWVRARAMRESYANGMSVHLHQLVQKHVKKQNLLETGDAHERGLEDLQKLIANSVPAELSIGTRNVVARALGIGTHNLFGTMDHAGHMGRTTGPFAGQPLLPDAEPSALPPAPVSSGRLAPPPVASQNQPAQLARPARPMVRLEADASIS